MSGPADATVPDGEAAAEPAEPAESQVRWQRLNARMIWADALRVLLSLAPAGVALLVIGVEPDAGVLWPVVAIAAWGVIGAAADVLRWVTTRYRLTDTHLERRTGLFFRSNRSIRRERVRSVDADARLLQRLAGLRRVRIGAGQMNTAMEAALHLDAVSRADAAELQRRLMGGHAEGAPAPRPATQQGESAVDVSGDRAGATADGSGDLADAPPVAAPPADASPVAGSGADPVQPPEHGTPETQVFSGLRWWWVWYNMFNFWAFFMAAGLLWGGWVTLTMFGFDPTGWLGGLADWEAIGTVPTVALAVAATWALGALGMGVNFVSEHWNFRLTRVPGENGTVLRTTQGLFRTREVNRDDNRLRGMTVSEPLLWRWMRMADTMVVSTGLSLWSGSATVVPRGPRSVSRRVVRAVLETDTSPLEAPLRRHPRAALRRRVVWALITTGTVSAVLGWLAATTALPTAAVAVTGPVLLVVSLGLAWAGYRSLGHTVTDAYLVVRSGAISRSTTALQRRAVSGVRVRQSLLQRRLGLATVSVSTAAGWQGYEAIDVTASESAALADRALPLGLAAFLTPSREAGPLADGPAESGGQDASASAGEVADAPPPPRRADTTTAEPAG